MVQAGVDRLSVEGWTLFNVSSSSLHQPSAAKMGPQLVRCGPANVAPAAPAPWPSLLSVHHMFVRPLALLVFQTVPGPCLRGWGQSCGSQGLGFTTWAHYSHDTESVLWRVCGVPCLGGQYLGCACLRWPLLATHPWLRGFPGSWRACGARGQKLAGLVAATNPGKSWRSLGLKSPDGYWSVGVSGHIQHSAHGGGGAFAGYGSRCLSGSTPGASRAGAGSIPVAVSQRTRPPIGPFEYRWWRTLLQVCGAAIRFAFWRNHHSNCNCSCVRGDMLWTI